MSRQRPHNLQIPPIAIPTLLPHPSLSSIPLGTTASLPNGPQPVPIPDEKLERGAELLRIYQTSLWQERLTSLPASSPHSLLAPPAAFATGSHALGHRRAHSTVSEVEGWTDMLSMASGQDDLGPTQKNSSSQVNGQAKRTRKRFKPAARARTHLVRFLGACDPCHLKGIKCDLFAHHDIARLQSIIDEQYRQSLTSNQAISSTSRMSQRTEIHGTSMQQGLSTAPQSVELQGIGTRYGNDFADLQSPGNDLLEDIQPPVALTFELTDTRETGDTGTSLYSHCAHGEDIVIGSQQVDYFTCGHLSHCQCSFNTREELETHFEVNHFPYTRVLDPIRHICRQCYRTNASPYMRCEHCWIHNCIDTHITGRFIRSAEHQYDADPGPPPILHQYPQQTYFVGAHTYPTGDIEMGGDLDNFDPDFGQNHSHNNNNSQSGYYDQSSNTDYGHTPQGSPYTERDSFNGSWQGDVYRSACKLAMREAHRRSLYHFCTRYGRALKQLFFVVLSLVLLIVYMTHDEMVVRVQKTFPHAGPELIEHLPTIIFVFTFLGFGMLFLLKHRIRPPYSYPPSTPCSLRVLKPYAQRYRSLRHDGYVRHHEHSRDC